MSADRPTEDPGALEPLAAVRRLGAAFEQATSALSDQALTRRQALEGCGELAKAMQRAGPLDAALEALLQRAVPGQTVAGAVAAAQARLAEVTARVTGLAGQIAELEGADPQLQLREEEGRRLLARREELARLEALAPDLETLRGELVTVGREIDRYQETTAVESGLVAAADRLGALLATRLQAFQAETRRALDDTARAAAELTAAEEDLTRRHQQAQGELRDLEARLVVLEEECQLLSSRLQAARERYAEVAAERDALLVPLQRYIAADREVADALDRYSSQPDVAEIREGLEAVERRLGLIDEALRDALAARQVAYDTQERQERR